MRNDLSYDAASIVTDSDTKELVEKAEEFSICVDTWLETDDPTLV